MTKAYLLLLVSTRATPACIVGAGIFQLLDHDQFGSMVHALPILERTGSSYDEAHEAVLRTIIEDESLGWVMPLLGPRARQDVVELLAKQEG